MARRFPGLRATSAVLLVLCSALFAAGCNTIPRAVELALRERPREYWVVVPEQREWLPALQLFLAHQRQRGFHVQLVGFDAERAPSESWEHVVRRLRERTDAASAYLLVLATPEELPMGPWHVEGAADPVASDLPLALELDLEQAATLTRDDLVRASSPTPRWIVGRIPFAEGPLVERALLASIAYSDAQRPPFALLGARRFAIPGDSSFALGRGKQRLVRAGIPSELWADAPQCDRRLGEHTLEVKHKAWVEIFENQLHVYVSAADLPVGRGMIEGELTEEVSPDFVERWVESDPEFVYLISHANAELHSLGRTLLGMSVLTGWDLLQHARVAPAHPAILLASGCSIGKPGDLLVRELFERGFIAAFAGSTARNGPLPLGPALNAQQNVAEFLARGASIGQTVQCAKAVYVQQSNATLTGWLLPFAREVWAVNLASYVIYGDPSLALGEARALPIAR